MSVIRLSVFTVQIPLLPSCQFHLPLYVSDHLSVFTVQTPSLLFFSQFHLPLIAVCHWCVFSLCKLHCYCSSVSFICRFMRVIMLSVFTEQTQLLLSFCQLHLPLYVSDHLSVFTVQTPPLLFFCQFHLPLYASDHAERFH